MHKYLPRGEERKNDFTHLARENRRNLTDAELKLWRLLRGRRFEGWKFRRQHQLLTYVVDFVCLENRLIIELDGGQHDQPGARAKDASRTRALEQLGFRVLRFWNNEVLFEEDAMAAEIYAVLDERKGMC